MSKLSMPPCWCCPHEKDFAMVLALYLGRCLLLFVIALICDVAGLVLLLLGIFGYLSYWDFFLYTGSLLLAFSLLFWAFWYTLNIEIPIKELGIWLAHNPRNEQTTGEQKAYPSGDIWHIPWIARGNVCGKNGWCALPTTRCQQNHRF